MTSSAPELRPGDEALLGQPLERLLATLPARVSEPLFTNAASAPDAPALSDHTGEHCSYAELAQRVRAMCAALEEHGVRPGDRLMLINENAVALGLVILAASELGAWPVVVNARMAAPEIEKIRSHCEPRLVIYTLDSAAAREHFERLEGGAGLRVRWAEAALGITEHPEVVPEHDVGEGNERIFTLIYTTGTTGDPKGVMLTHRNVLYVAAVTSALRGLRSEDRIYCVLPVSHVFGLAAVFLACLYTGAELVMADRFDVEGTLSTLARRDITGLFGVPTMFARLAERIRNHGLPEGGLPHLRFMYSGGAPLEPSLKAEVERCFALPLLNAYGMTESAPTICQVRHDQPLESRSVGRPLPGLDLRVIEAEGRTVARGEVGELHIRGPNVMRGYYRNPEATAAAFDDEGYLNTGDLVYQDEEDDVFLVGRSKELIIRSGFNVYPPEVEAALGHHPDVLLCAVIGEASAGDEEVVAYVQRVPGSTLTEQELLDFVRPHLTAYKRPSRIVFREELPTAPSGKVLKHQLRGGER